MKKPVTLKERRQEPSRQDLAWLLQQKFTKEQCFQFGRHPGGPILPSQCTEAVRMETEIFALAKGPKWPDPVGESLYYVTDDRGEGGGYCYFVCELGKDRRVNTGVEINKEKFSEIRFLGLDDDQRPMVLFRADPKEQEESIVFLYGQENWRIQNLDCLDLLNFDALMWSVRITCTVIDDYQKFVVYHDGQKWQEFNEKIHKFAKCRFNENTYLLVLSDCPEGSDGQTCVRCYEYARTPITTPVATLFSEKKLVDIEQCDEFVVLVDERGQREYLAVDLFEGEVVIDDRAESYFAGKTSGKYISDFCSVGNKHFYIGQTSRHKLKCWWTMSDCGRGGEDVGFEHITSLFGEGDFQYYYGSVGKWLLKMDMW